MKSIRMRYSVFAAAFFPGNGALVMICLYFSGIVLSVLRENNKQIVYEYDGLNRLVKIDYPDTEDTVYTYGGANSTHGAANRILSVTDASGTLEYEYGKLGEVTRETRTLATHLNRNSPTETAVMQYRSDYLGRMQHIIYPDGEKITYGYDNGGATIS